MGNSNSAGTNKFNNIQQSQFKPQINNKQKQTNMNNFQQQPQISNFQQQPQRNNFQQQPQRNNFQQQPQMNSFQQQPQRNNFQQQPQMNSFHQQPQMNSFHQQPQVNNFQQQPQVNNFLNPKLVSTSIDNLSQQNNRMLDRQFNFPNIDYNPDNSKYIYRNDNNQYNTNSQTYLPRVEQPMIQKKMDRNTMEKSYQNAYEERHKDSGFTNLQQNFNDNYSNNIENQKYDDLELSLKIFNLSKEFNETQLKNNYKELVIKYHPDRGGNNEQFQLINKCYTYLLKYLELRIKDAQYQQLKQQSNDYLVNQETHQNINFDKDKFNIDKFNTIFNDNKFEDNTDEGYSNWINETKFNSEDIKRNNNLNGKFSLDNFNNEFNNNKTEQTTDLVTYKDPIPTELNKNLNFSEIDNQNNGDYSSDPSSQLLYTDYRKAHTKTHLINTNSVKRQQFKNVDDLETHRANINYQMSETDLLDERLLKEQKEEEERKRIERIKSHDNKIEKHFNKVNKLMVGQ